MKKILAILAMATAGTAFAGSFTVEGQQIDSLTGANQKQYSLSVKENITKEVTGDVSFSNTTTDGTSALTTRLEGGLTGLTQQVGPIKGYVRVAAGQKFSNTTDFSYYSVEPGVLIPMGNFTGRIGYRYRSAFDSTANNDQTNTWRAGLSYALTKQDTVGVRYDQMRGDTTQNTVAVNYTRGF
jgi:opacity protein-like surface antigen